jgi:amino acid adenylation domain-containing protein/non-ribosomal peptide synthase protein (TIGR01720 family)
MKPINEFLSELTHLNIKLWVEDEQLRCKAPKGALTATLHTELAERKAEIMAFLSDTQPDTPDATLPPIIPISQDNNHNLPLSFAQQRLWFLDQLEESNSATYNMASALNLQGPLHFTALKQSLLEIVQRHETLRTTFQMLNGTPVQMIHPFSTESLKLSMVDLRHLPSETQLLEVQRLANEDAQRPFTLTKGPLLRTTLWQLGPQEHVIGVTMHHIISDAWSLGLFIREFTTLYEAFSKGQSSPLPPLPIQYADFAYWQRQWLSRELLQKQLNYWQQQLAEMPTLLGLPSDHPRPPIQRFQGNIQSFEINKELSNKLTQLGQTNNATLFMVLLAAFVILLERYSGNDDLVVGSPIAGRNNRQTESLIGFFVNTLVLRLTCSGNPSFLNLLVHVKQVCLDAYAHQDVPFEQLVEVLQPERNLSHTPLFQVLFVLQNTPTENLTLANLKISPFAREHVTAKFDLTLSITETNLGLVGTFEYNTDLFEAATIERMVGHFQTLLHGIVENPQQQIHEIPLLTDAEYQQLMAWNDTATDYPQDKCIHQLFEAQVERSPDSIAVLFEDQQLTYQALNSKANQLAHYLQTLGVKPEVLVGICVERSVEMVIGLLGILKAGGAYLPLDMAYPAARLAFMLEDAQVPVLLTQESLTLELPRTGAQIVYLDVEVETLSQYSSETVISEVGPENLAYVGYTSGSTGQPKGVSIVHRSVNRLVKNTNYANLTADQTFLQLAPLAFDASTFEIWASLLNGAKLVVMPPHTPSLEELGLSIKQYQVTTLWLTAGLFHLMVEERIEDLSSVRQLLAGGDVLSVPHVRKVLRELKNCQLINGYGPTENTTFTCCCPITENQIGASIPIGKPIANSQVYILDSYLQLVPIGVPGELHISGAGLARGYLNHPDLTIPKFIPNPLSDAQNARLYKTGDLARYLPDGHIEYLGRIDNQVKIRGFRIELGEIETVLSQHPFVQENVVIVLPESSNHKQLIAYLVPNPDQVFDNLELCRFLKEKLPDYMIPAAFVTLDALPLTPNGKVDRRTLSKWSVNREVSNKNFVAPRTLAEKQLADIWTAVLGLKKVGIHNNFFELGGDSIISIQVISRANQVGLQLTPKQLFQHQTIAELAAVASKTELIRQAEQGLVTGSVPLTPIQYWFFEQNLLNPHHFNQSVLLEVSPNLTQAHLEIILPRLLQHHDALRLRFSKSREQLITDNYSLRIDSGSLITVKDLSTHSANNLGFQIEATATELQASLNLSEGPLLRVALFKLGNNQYNRLLFIIHHLAVDGVSWRIWLEDFTTVYQQLSRGEEIALPSKTTSFKQWAEYLVKYAYSDIIVSELNYWLAPERLNVTPLPLDYPSSVTTNTLDSSAQISVSLSIEHTQALLQEVSEAYQTRINDMLLTALVQSLTQWIGSLVLLIDLEGHGREELFEEIDTSRTVGWFTSIFPVLLDLSGVSNHAGERLKSVKEQLRQIPNKGIGYGLLRYLNPETGPRLQALPQAQIVFNYLGQFSQTFSKEPFNRIAKEATGSNRSRSGLRRYLLEINSLIHEGRLQMNWTYSKNIYRRTTIEGLAQDFIKKLTSLITHCLSPEAGGYTPSDFPLVNLDQAMLDKILVKRQVHDLYPLSPMQEGLLFHTLYAPESGVYFEQFHFTLEGELNLWAFQRAWQHLINRHTILRTSFVWEGLEKPVQIVYKQAKLPWVQLDLRQLTAREQQERLTVFLRQDKKSGFDLTTAPVMRGTLIRLTEQTYHFIWSYHHILLDGWCLPIVFQEVLTNYEAFCQGNTIHFESPRPYREYIAWLQQQDISKAEAFWKRQLQGFLAPTPFRVDNQADNVNFKKDKEYQEQTFALSKTTTDALQSYVQQHHLTLNTLVQGAWALLLNCYSGEADIVFGATVSGRPAVLAEVESMLGLFINTLPVRVQISFESILLPWLEQLQVQQVEREQYSYTPLVDIQGWSDVPANVPLFESIIAFENYPIDNALREKPSEQLDIRLVHVIGMTHYPLTVIVSVFDSKLSFQIGYETDRFTADTIARMMGHVETLLESMIASPEQRLSELSLLTEAERHQLLVTWNYTQTEYPKDQCIHQLFEAQVERTPDAIAVVFENQQLTYQDLNQKANQIAHYLQTLGVKPDVFVGICIERSLDMVIGLLGILKAGGAYVPLDPSHPKERLAFLIEDANLHVLLTFKEIAEKLLSKAQVVCLDTHWENLSQFRDNNPISEVTSDNLAYVIYTSGSTGKPKGVLVNHYNVTRLFAATEAWFHFNEQDVWTLFHSYAFDFSVWEIWGALLSGGRLIVVPYWISRSPEAFYDLLSTQHVTVLNQTPSAFRQLMQAEELAESQKDLDLRFVIFGGEALDFQSLKPWFKRHGDNNPQLINMYGITETTVHVTYHPLTLADLNSLASVIGFPIPDLQTYILDTCIQPIPIGVPGELHIGGAGLARGYLNHPDLTAEKFIANPFSEKPGSRLYKTGDLTRYLPDGNIEYLGRIDNQVKIRGFRIELGEIEAVLATHNAVQQNVVIVQELEPSNKHLVAFLVPNPGQVIENQKLRAFLKERLPDYMIPSAWVTLEAIPLTPNGKIDRRTLSQWKVDRSPSQEATFVAPRTSVEELIAETWSQVIKTEKIGIYDNFFELGGNSLLTIQVINNLQSLFKIQLQVRDLYQEPTVAGIAKTLVKLEPQEGYIETIASLRQEVAQMSKDDVETALKNQ